MTLVHGTATAARHAKLAGLIRPILFQDVACAEFIAGKPMLNRRVKLMLVATSLVPTLLVMAVDSIYREENLSCFSSILLLSSVFLFAYALYVMTFAAKNGERMQLVITKVKNTDKEVLTFLLAYLLPILSDHKYIFKDFNLPTLAIIILISIAVYHSNAFDFNPLLGMCGYHFYEVQGDDDFPYLLISTTPLIKPKNALQVVKLFDYTFLCIGEISGK